MVRYFLEIAYNGSNYNGWQEQKNARGIQEVIGKSISLIIKAPVKLIGSGRTDTGVHALGQVAHMETSREVKPAELCHRLNRFLPVDISIIGIYPVTENAHARYSAIARIYEYRIINFKDPFRYRRAWYLRDQLDMGLLNDMSAIMMEFNDFRAFSRVKTDVENFRCRISSATWIRQNGQLKFTIRSDRFLRGMVRAIVGTLVEAGKGKISDMDFKNIILGRDRRLAGPAAPAYGLYLSKVEYPENIFVKL